MAGKQNFAGDYDGPDFIAGIMESSGMARSYSMDITNDPRFFQDNIINYRLAAFGSVAVVSGLMTQNAMDQLFDMDKNMQIFTNQGKTFHWNGVIQLVAFFILILILFINMIATYITVAQPYHTIRLMTAGPTGFEAAASYYLNRNITIYRHAAVRTMLFSLPLYIVQMGLRLVVKFDRTTMAGADLPKTTPVNSFVEGWLFSILMFVLAFVLWLVHLKHFSVFRDRYKVMSANITNTPDFTSYMASTMTPKNTFGYLDV